jgi:hypothetical protein
MPESPTLMFEFIGTGKRDSYSLLMFSVFNYFG